ncbi:YbaB/EbfC family DNA-binding protein [Mycobacterium sp. MBM]|nr:YbaB/EbfC family DNA-binding protein [Mycobacterium sp. MBM]
MTNDDPWDDDHDDVLESSSTISDLDAFADYGPPEPIVEFDEGRDPVSGATDDQNAPDVSFTVSNPAGTVAVTALLGGRISRISIEPSVGTMTESELAEEISFLSGLATQKALAAQHGVVSTLMQEVGHESGVVCDFLERERGFPSPQRYLEHTAAAFADRYGQQ